MAAAKEEPGSEGAPAGGPGPFRRESGAPGRSAPTGLVDRFGPFVLVATPFLLFALFVLLDRMLS